MRGTGLLAMEKFMPGYSPFSAVSVHREAVTKKVLNSYILPKKSCENENSLTIVHNYVIFYQVVYHISYIIYHGK